VIPMRNPYIRLVDSSPSKGSQLPKTTLGVSFPHNHFSQRVSYGINSLKIRRAHVVKNLTEASA